MQSVLISDPDDSWSHKVQDYFRRSNLYADIAYSGKEALLFLFKKKFDALLIDINTKNHSAFDVMKSVKIKFPALKIILTFPNRTEYKQWEEYKDKFEQFGISDILIKPYELEKLVASLEGEIQHEQWSDIKIIDKIVEEKVVLRDSECTKIPIGDFFLGNVMVFDIYIRLGKDNFVKILHKGNRFDPAILKKYKDKNVTSLYFKTKDRSLYIDRVSELLEELINKASVKTEKKVKVIKGIAQQYIDEVYQKGLSPKLAQQGNEMVESVYHVISRDAGMIKLLREFEEISPAAYSHQFLVMFFSIIICKNLSWVSDMTVKIVAQGAMLHDIGKLKLPPELRDIAPENMSKHQLELYMQHPMKGVELLDKFPSVSEAVKQIVFQHHEVITGEGFPNKLSGIKIYPLAKVVAFVDYYANYMMRNKKTPLDALKDLLVDRRIVQLYDAAVIKALIQGFKK